MERRSVLDGVLETLRATTPRVALADGDDIRAVLAANSLAGDGLVAPVLVGLPGSTAAVASDLGVVLADGVEIEECDPGADPLWHAMTLVEDGDVVGCVAGATRTTSEVLRAAINVVGLEPGTELVTSSSLLLMTDGRTVVFADCAVVPDPDTGQLVTIARAAARTLAELTGEPPLVAMLSYSTHGSATGESVDKVRSATELLRKQAPELAVDGELQFDTAFDQNVAERKAPDSPVAGAANVFVFPSLDAANIAYKITERVGGAVAIGPLLSGLAAPVHDLSRGCSTEDIHEIAAIAGLQALRRQEAP